MVTLVRLRGVACVGGSLAVLAACGGGTGSNGTASSSARHSASPSPSPSPTAVAVDSCLVGTWISAGLSGNPDGQPGSSISGGAGEKLTIQADGTVQVDSTGIAAVTVTQESRTVQIKQSGTAQGHVTAASAGRFELTLDPGGTLQNQGMDAAGNPLGTPQAAPMSESETYQCTAGRELRLIDSPIGGGSVTTTFHPA